MNERLELNDELLCAYMDGELDAAMRVRIERALLDDTGARVRLERMRAADERLRTEIPLPGLQPDDPLSERILGDESLPPVVRKSPRWGVAVSALAAGIGGVVVGLMLSRAQEPAPALVASTSPSLSGVASSRLLLATLENGTSGTAVADDGNRSVQIILTFESDDGRYCRAFGARDASTAGEGVACRADEQWQLIAWDGTANPHDGFRTAGSSELLDAAMDRLGNGAALGVADERRLIERHWQTH